MATTTTNLGLTKPIGTEKALVSVINGNMDIIDNKVGAIPQNESTQSQITALNNQIANFLKIEHITAKPTSALSAGAYGYWAVPIHNCKNKTIIATNISLGHPGAAGGYVLTGSYVSGDYVYVSYYTPIALAANVADFVVDITYSDNSITYDGYVENL